MFHRHTITTALTLTALALDAQGAIDTWRTAANGTWGLNSSWTDNSVPGTGDSATFNLVGSYQATFDAQAAAIQALTVTGSGVNPLFQSNMGVGPFTLNVTSALNGGTRNASVLGGAILTLGNPTNFTFRALHLNVGNELFVGTGGILNVTRFSQVTAASVIVNQGSMSFVSGGTGSFGSLQVAPSAGPGTVNVTGSGVTLSASGTFDIGGGATGALNIQSGGSCTTTGALCQVAVNGGSTGTVTVTGTNSQWAHSGTLQLAWLGNGTLNITDGGTVTLGGDITDNGGGVSTLTLDGGTLNMQGRNIGGATPVDTLNFRAGTLRNVGQINNGATVLTKTAAGTLTLDTSNGWSGGTSVDAGVLLASNTSGSATGSGAVTVASGATLQGTGIVSGLVQNHGTVAPGAAVGTAGTLALGSFAQFVGATLDVEIGGTSAGTQYDRLAITGIATLGGTLRVTLINGFTPSVGQTFDVLAAGGTDASFNAIQLPALTGSIGWRVVYTPLGLRLQVANCGATDADGDGFRDPCDSCPGVANPSQADSDRDGTGDACDTCTPGWVAGPLDGVVPNGTDDPFSCCPPVQAMTTWDPDESGPTRPMLVVGGTFSGVEGVSANRIAARDADTGFWQRLGVGLNGTQESLTVYNGELISGNSASLAPSRWNGSSWTALGGGVVITGCCQGYVRSMFTYANDLFAGGHFTTAGGVDASNIARWNGTAWSSVTAFNELAGQPGVNALIEYNGDLVAGGGFAIPLIAGGGHNIAMLRPGIGHWEPVGNSFEEFGYVSALAVYNGQLIAAGTIKFTENDPVIGIARWIGPTGNWTPLPGGDVDFGIDALIVYNGELIAAGGGNGLANTFHNIARWNGATWRPLGSGIGATGATVRSLWIYDDDLIAGGRFASAGGVPANNLARWNGSEWSAFGGGGINSINALATLGPRAIAAGDFVNTTSVPQRAYNIVGYDGLELTPLGSGMNAPVLALTGFTNASNDRELVAGGFFNAAGGVAAGFVARWIEDPTGSPPAQWQPMGVGLNSAVLALERFRGRTVAAGAFTFSSTNVNRIARFNETTSVWEPMGAGGGGMNDNVRALKANSLGITIELVAGGDFTTAGGAAANRIAVWTEGPNIPNPIWSPMGTGFNNSVYAIERYASSNYAGGAFTASGTTTLNRIARWNGTSWGPVGNGVGFNAPVRALKSIGPYLYATGDFTSVDGIVARHTARYNGTSWEEVRGGTDDNAFAILSYNNEVLAGGQFQVVQAGTLESPGLARFLDSGGPWIAEQPTGQDVPCGGDAHFHLDPAQGYNDLSFQWRKDGVPIVLGPTGTGSTITSDGPSLNVLHVSQADTGSYTCVVSNTCGSATSLAAALTVQTCPCGSADFNCDGDLGTDADIQSFFACLAGNCPPSPCTSNADFNGDGDLGTDADISAFFRVLAGGSC